MKVYSSKHIKELENIAVNDGITMSELMFSAGTAVGKYLSSITDIKNKKIVILCGKGNNGGDGFVLANYLFEHAALTAVVLAQGKPSTSLAEEAYNNMYEVIPQIEWNEQNKSDIENLISTADIIVDAIFGFGFHGEIKGTLAELITIANETEALKIAVDVPSGAECDTGAVYGPCFMANHTVTFTGIKPAAFLEPAKSFFGKTVVASVGIDSTKVFDYPTKLSAFLPWDAKRILPKRDPLSNKGTFGKLLMVCGSYGMVGACIMAAKGALRSGVGLLNIVTDDRLYPILAASIPEAIYTILDSSDLSSEENKEKLLSAMNTSTAILTGSGLGNNAEIFVPLILENAKVPVVLDADALNYISRNMELLEKEYPFPIIITPHPGEMSRLCSKTVKEVQSDRFDTALSFSEKYKIYTVLKGNGTLISSPEGETIINTTGNAGMAKGGSGDVLAGMLASLTAQGVNPMDAASLAVYAHGKAGDLAAEKLSQTSMLPTDLIEYIPCVFKEIEG